MITKRDTVIVSSISFLVLACTLIFGVATAQQETGKQQLFIKNNNIKSITDFGEYLDPAYREFYKPYNLFDNLTNTWSFWSQYGSSGFQVELKNPLDKLVCSVDIGVKDPTKNIPFGLVVSNAQTSKTVQGVLDSANKNVDIPQCIPNLNGIEFTFNPTLDPKWTILSEVKLFSNSSVVVPPVDPPICPAGQHYNDQAKKCEDDVPPTPPINETVFVTNSTVNFDIKNSTMTINADSVSEIIINAQGANVTTTNSNETNIIPTTPIGTPLPPSQDDNEDNDKDKDKDKDKDQDYVENLKNEEGDNN